MHPHHNSHRPFLLLILFVLLTLLTALPVSADPAPPVAPLNDNFADALPLVLNTRITVQGDVSLAENEPDEASDIDLLYCEMWHTVWYWFVPTFDGTVLLSTAGSEVFGLPHQSHIRTSLAVYTGTTLAGLTQAACGATNLSGYGELPAFEVSAGTTYFVRVGLDFQDPSSVTLKLRTMVHGGTDWDPTGMLNTGFETPPTDADWQVKNATNGDMQECGTGNAYEGMCAFKLVGGAGEATKLKQKRSWPVDQLLGYVGHRMEFSGYVYSVDPATLKFKIVLKYSDGTPATKRKASIINTAVPLWDFFKVAANFESPNVKSVKLIIQNGSPSGVTYIDRILLDYDGGYVRTLDGALLPVPAPMQ